MQLDSHVQMPLAGKFWMQRVPNDTTLTVDAGATLTTKAWDGTSGGLLLVRVAGAATINGSISMAMKGYAGGALLGMNTATWVAGWTGENACGASFQSKTGSCGGGGAGNAHNTAKHRSGGGGGGYGTAGTDGRGQTNMTTTEFGYGGVAYGSPQLATQLLLGPGGGGGTYNYSVWLDPVRGGNGGGAIVLLADSVTFGAGGELNADGENTPVLVPAAAEVGGGGASGAFYVAGTNLSLGTTRIHAVGGNGCPGACCGGNGGVGHIAIKGTSISGTTSPTWVVGN